MAIINMIREIKNRIKISFRKTQLKKLAKSDSIKIVVGASRVYEAGWLPTEIEILNLLKEEDWNVFFKENSIDAILAEHVWEHLNLSDGLKAAKVCYKYLKPGGYLRVAVPDGSHPDPEYIEYVRPGGTGAGADDHKVLYNEGSFRKLFQEAGFQVKALEWFDENGIFHFEEWDIDDGMIWRSKRFDERNKTGQLNYTSLIIDAVK